MIHRFQELATRLTLVGRPKSMQRFAAKPTYWIMVQLRCHTAKNQQVPGNTSYFKSKQNWSLR